MHAPTSNLKHLLGQIKKYYDRYVRHLPFYFITLLHKIKEM